jgi:hypothetical protein
VIGDNNSAVGTSVTFWGAHWWKLNMLSGGGAPASFKGFEDSPVTARCGQTWTADPGNSTPPPSAPLPAYMAVIVSSSISNRAQRSRATPAPRCRANEPGLPGGSWPSGNRHSGRAALLKRVS